MKGPFKWERWHAVVALVGTASLITVLAVALKGRDESSAKSSADAALSTAANAPDGLLCDLYVAVPNASWTKLQRGVGGAVGILPATLPGLIVVLADLEISLADELDGTAPMYGVAAGDPADPGFALAIKLVDARRARGVLAAGDAGRYAAKEAPGMTLLVPNRASAQKDHRFGIAITDNGYLLMSRNSADLERLGPYVTRTLPSRPLPVESSAVVDIPRSALKTILKPKLEAFWRDGRSFLLRQDERMRAERGRAPDFGDPAAIVAALDSVLGRRLAIIGDLDHVRLAFDVMEDATVVTATLAPMNEEANEARKWISAMKLGDASPVLELPAVSALALSTRDGDAERAEQAKSLENAITSSLGPRLKEPGKLHEVIDAMTKGRGDSFALALGVDEPAGLLVRAPVRDADAENKAIRGAFELTRVEPFKELLRARDMKSESQELPGLGKINVITLLRDAPRAPSDNAKTPRRAGADAGAPAPSNKAPPAVGVAWIMEQNALALGAGTEPVVTLKMGAKPDKKLADEPSLKRFTSAIGSDASTIIIGQPLRLDPKRANLPTAPIGIAAGKKGNDAFVRVDVSAALLREAARWQMGF